MIINILDRTLKLIDIIDDAQSVIWTKRFWEPGDFEIYMIANEKNMNKVQQGYFLSRDEDDTVMIIEEIKITTDVENGNYLTISGRSAESIIGRRVNTNNRILTTFAGPGQSRLEYIFNRCIVELAKNNWSNSYYYPFENSTSYNERNIDIVHTDYLWGDKTNDNLQIYNSIYSKDFNGSLLNLLQEESKKVGYGFKFTIKVFSQKKKLYLQRIIPTDRSINQTTTPQVLFSKQYDNVITTNYNKSMKNFYNFAVINGEGEGWDRKKYWATLGSVIPSGLDRYELMIDARDISSNVSDGVMPIEDYKNLLIERGKEKLTEHFAVQIFEGEIDPTINFIYKRDYFLGDIVTIENEYGISADVRITAVTECEDENGYYYIPIYENVEV